MTDNSVKPETDRSHFGESLGSYPAKKNGSLINPIKFIDHPLEFQ